MNEDIKKFRILNQQYPHISNNIKNIFDKLTPEKYEGLIEVADNKHQTRLNALKTLKFYGIDVNTEDEAWELVLFTREINRNRKKIKIKTENELYWESRFKGFFIILFCPIVTGLIIISCMSGYSAINYILKNFPWFFPTLLPILILIVPAFFYWKFKSNIDKFLNSYLKLKRELKIISICAAIGLLLLIFCNLWEDGVSAEERGWLIFLFPYFTVNLYRLSKHVKHMVDTQ